MDRNDSARALRYNMFGPKTGYAIMEKRIVVGDLISEGSGGKVYNAHFRKDPKRRVVVKMVYRGDIGGEFLAACEAAEGEPHQPVEAYLFDKSDDLYVLVENRPRKVRGAIVIPFMPVCLFDIIRESRVTPIGLKILSRTLLTEVKRVHAIGLVHRDIKLENVMLFDEHLTCARLVDYGLATRSTEMTEVCGTVGYMPPEMLRNETYDAKCDVFSLGVTLFAAVAGYNPFESDTISDICDRTVRGLPYLDTAAYAEIPGDARDFLRALMANDPADRPTAAEALDHPFVRE